MKHLRFLNHLFFSWVLSLQRSWQGGGGRVGVGRLLGEPEVGEDGGYPGS